LSNIRTPWPTDVWLSGPTEVTAVSALARQTVVRSIAEPAVARSETITDAGIRGKCAGDIAETRPVASTITEEISSGAAGQCAAETGRRTA
jgi:hypothetical protein